MRNHLLSLLPLASIVATALTVAGCATDSAPPAASPTTTTPGLNTQTATSTALTNKSYAGNEVPAGNPPTLPPFNFPPLFPPPAGQPGQPASNGGPSLPAQRPLLTPLIGSQMWQAEVRAVINELISNLAPDNQAKVRTIPLIFDPNANEINAYAACDEHGSPSITGTEGLLEAIDAVAQTRATDDLYGTQTYEAYSAQVIKQLGQSPKSSAALPLGLIPIQYLADPRRLSHAREYFDDMVAFTFGHELAHHYLGHTGCAVGTIPNPFGSFALNAIGKTPIQQAFEETADQAGVTNAMDAGWARMHQGQYRWSDRGANFLLDFFARLESYAGLTPLNPIGYLQTHPPAHVRIGWLPVAVNFWRARHPGS